VRCKLEPARRSHSLLSSITQCESSTGKFLPNAREPTTFVTRSSPPFYFRSRPDEVLLARSARIGLASALTLSAKFTKFTKFIDCAAIKSKSHIAVAANCSVERRYIPIHLRGAAPPESPLTERTVKREKMTSAKCELAEYKAHIEVRFVETVFPRERVSTYCRCWSRLRNRVNGV